MNTQNTLRKAFEKLEDPRVERTEKHPFHSILFLAICAAMAGIDEWMGMQDYCEANFEKLSEIIPFPHGVPSHDTIGRVISRIDSEEFLTVV